MQRECARILLGVAAGSRALCETLTSRPSRSDARSHCRISRLRSQEMLADEEEEDEEGEEDEPNTSGWGGAHLGQQSVITALVVCTASCLVLLVRKALSWSAGETEQARVSRRLP